MADRETIRNSFERNARALELRPAVGRSKTVAKVRILDGTSCEVEGSGWTLKADVGAQQGGNDAGPGPGVYARAALGSCLAINYVTWAARLDIPIDSLEVEVETEFDARGMFGVSEDPPGFVAVRYRVLVKSPAPESQIREFIDRADRFCPTLDDFKRPLPVERDIVVQSVCESHES